jgi:hypothetical protein
LTLPKIINAPQPSRADPVSVVRPHLPEPYLRAWKTSQQAVEGSEFVLVQLESARFNVDRDKLTRVTGVNAWLHLRVVNFIAAP